MNFFFQIAFYYFPNYVFSFIGISGFCFDFLPLVMFFLVFFPKVLNHEWSLRVSHERPPREYSPQVTVPLSK